MAWYKNVNVLKQSNSDAYDKLHSPGSTVPHSGIYRCQGCGREIASNGGDPFPPQNHHQHATAQGTIRWRLIVFADHESKAA
jgi:hypothetical protein